MPFIDRFLAEGPRPALSDTLRDICALTGADRMTVLRHAWDRYRRDGGRHVVRYNASGLCADVMARVEASGATHPWLAAPKDALPGKTVHIAYLMRTQKSLELYPRRAMGHLLGAGARFGLAGEVMAFGEGIETTLSLREIAPALPLVAGLSAAHLAALEFPDPLRRLYVARDRDAAGLAAYGTIAERSMSLGIDIRPLDPRPDDFNSDLVRMGRKDMSAWVRTQMQPLDAMRLLGR